MARLKKEEVIKALTEAGIEFDPEGKYNALAKLLKEHEAAKPKTVANLLGAEVVKELHKKTGFASRLILAAGNAGFIEEQIKQFADEDALHAAVLRIKPQFLASAGVPADPRPPKPVVEMVETSSPLTFELSAMRAKNLVLRSNDEDRNIEAFMNRTGIRRTLTRMVIDRSYKPKGTKYVTEVTFYYMVPKGVD